MMTRSRLNRLLFLSLVLLGCLSVANAQTRLATGGAGSLDRSFNGTGYVITPSQRPYLTAYAVAIQTDGKIVTAGVDRDESTSEAAVARYLPNGSLDPTFGGSGIVRTGLAGFNLSASGLALQPDGKIVIAGGASTNTGGSIFLARYDPFGALDTSFGVMGIVRISLGKSLSDSARSVALQTDGKIVIAGTSFSTSGRIDFVVARFEATGSLDPSFNQTGYAVTGFNDSFAFAQAVVIQPDGKIVVVGQVGPELERDFAVARYNADGTLDPSFNGTGQVVTPVGSADDLARSVALQLDGKIVVVGSSIDFRNSIALVRYEANGSLDTSFNDTGTLISEIGPQSRGSAVAVQTDGKIVVAGDSLNGSLIELTVARYHKNGSADTSFNGTGYVTTSIETHSVANAIALQSDGKIVAAGVSLDSGSPARSSFAIVRYLATSSVNFDYDGDGKTDISVFRPSSSEWYLLRSGAGLYGVSFGANGDRAVPADYDGDGKTDVGVYRPSNGIWYVLNSSNGTVAYTVFGAAEDLPTPADYDGDGKADISVFRPSSGTWFRLNSSNNSFFGYQFGASTDKPATGDYDGDGKADLSVFRPSDGSWYRVNSSNGSLFGTQFGAAGDLITPSDYDGDAKTDIAVYRPSAGAWYRLNSGNGSFASVVFGAAADVPAPGDFDGDGKADVNVFRPSDGTWYRLNSSNGTFVAQPFGANGDLPTPAAFRY